ncbi:hypothetical protein ACJU26_08830 [Acidithiobacillus sp. M4-SHS-6]|uniref:hypothetical protein n=1 Tax=Acidithiobacillus sp. M4-SHS-6 TaxID=3383024 RepID=UPI0039BE84F2
MLVYHKKAQFRENIGRLLLFIGLFLASSSVLYLVPWHLQHPSGWLVFLAITSLLGALGLPVLILFFILDGISDRKPISDQDMPVLVDMVKKYPDVAQYVRDANVSGEIITQYDFYKIMAHVNRLKLEKSIRHNQATLMDAACTERGK